MNLTVEHDLCPVYPEVNKQNKCQKSKAFHRLHLRHPEWMKLWLIVIKMDINTASFTAAVRKSPVAQSPAERTAANEEVHVNKCLVCVVTFNLAKLRFCRNVV